jgi:hypothetical protein
LWIISASALAIGLLWGAGGATVIAQSPSPGDSTSGACAGLVELLPQQLDGGVLTSSVMAGSDMSAPGPFAPALAATGITTDGLCFVFFAYRSDTAATGGLVRFSGADASKALAPFLDALALPCQADGTCAPTEITVEGRPVTQVPSPGHVTDFYVFGDTIFYGIDGPQFAAILSGLPASGAPLPDVSAPNPTPTLIPTPTPIPMPTPSSTPV